MDAKRDALSKKLSSNRSHPGNLHAIAWAAAVMISLCTAPSTSRAQVALPQGGAYLRGAGSITQSGQSSLINTVTAPGKVAVINWGGGFNVGAGGQVTFNNATGAASLNAINIDPTGKMSNINGQVRGTGAGMNIVVVNPNGISVGSGARINTTGSFAAIAGTVESSTISGTGAGAVNIMLNNAPIIVNAAVATQSVALGKLETGTDKAMSMTSNAGSQPNSLPVVLGSADIKIEGAGTVQGSGVVAASGESYKLSTAGSVSFVGASVFAAKKVSITGKEVSLTNSRVETLEQGSMVNIGGGARGQDASIKNAEITIIDESSVIKTGEKSSVVVWGDRNRFAGRIENAGGNAEVSGHELNYAGVADLRGPGKVGTLLLDPDDLVIDAAGGAYSAQGFGTTGTSTITGAGVSTALQTASVVLDANNSIVVQDAITSTTVGSDLTLRSGGLVSIGGPISIKGKFEARVGVASATPIGATPEIRMLPGGKIETNGGLVNLVDDGAQGASTFTSVAGTGVVNGVTYQGSHIDAGGGDVNVALGGVTLSGVDVKTSGAGKIDVNTGDLSSGWQEASTTAGVTSLGQGIWASELGNLTINASNLTLAGATVKTNAVGTGSTGGNIQLAAGGSFVLGADASGTKPGQILAIGASDAAKTGDVLISVSSGSRTGTFDRSTIYSGPRNNPNGTPGVFSVQPGSIEINPNTPPFSARMYVSDAQISNLVSWGTNSKSAPITISGYIVSIGAGASAYSPTSGGVFAEGNWYPSTALPGLGKPSTFLTSRPEAYQYPLINTGGLLNLRQSATGGVEAVHAGSLDAFHNIVFGPAFTPPTYKNIEVVGNASIDSSIKNSTTFEWIKVGGNFSYQGSAGVTFKDTVTVGGSVSLWNKAAAGAAPFNFATGSSITSTSAGEGISLAAANLATDFNFNGNPLPIFAPTGRWLFYSTGTSAVGTAAGFGPAESFHRYNCVYGGSPGACGNAGSSTIAGTSSGTGYIYGYAPSLTVDSGSLTSTYGTAPNYAAGRLLSGYIGADAGIDVVSGTTLVSGGLYSSSGNLSAGTQSVKYASGLASALGYKLTPGANFTVMVAPKTVTVNGLVGVDRVYDGTTAAELSAPGASVTGLVAGDGVDGSALGVFANKNVGSGKAITLSGWSVSGVDAGNYVVANSGNQAMASATVTTKPIRVDSGVVVADKTYDGTAVAAVDVSGANIGGYVGGDVVSVASGTGVFDDKNAGAGKSVTFTAFGLAGADAGNYVVDLAVSQAGATATIEKKVATIVSGLVGSNRVYDGTTAATADGVASVITGKVAGDDLFGSASGSFADKGVGSGKPVTLSSWGFTGADADNYTVSMSGNQVSTTATITPRPVTIGGGSIAGVDKVYDRTTAASVVVTGGQLNGKIAGDDLNLTATATFSDKNAGVGKVVNFGSYGISGSDASNYNVTLIDPPVSTTTTASISPRPITIGGGSISGVDKVYDSTTVASVVVTGGQLTGKIAGDDVNLTATASFNDKNAGMGKVINFGSYGVSGTDASNYNVTLTNPPVSTTTTANISPRPITIGGGSIAGVDKVYDSTTVASVVVTGGQLTGKIVGDDVNLTATAAFIDKNAGVGKVVNFGNFGISGTDASNYNVTMTNPPVSTTTMANIATRPITIGGGSITGVDKVYDRTTTASVVVTGGQLNGKIAGDDLSLTTTATFSDKNAGVGKVVNFGGYGVSGTDASNYNVTMINPPSSSTATASITPRPVAVSGAVVGDKTFDGSTAIPVNAASASVSGILPGDVVAVNSGAVSANFLDSSVGSGKTITYVGSNVLSGADAANYVGTPNATPGFPATGNIFAAAPTPAPTAAPTPAPTPAPTAAPTPAPTPAPTAAPTPAPTPAPTAAPTPAPTPAPTAAPTPAPTAVSTASLLPRDTIVESVFGGWVVEDGENRSVSASSGQGGLGDGGAKVVRPEVGVAGSLSLNLNSGSSQPGLSEESKNSGAGASKSGSGGANSVENCVAQAAAGGLSASAAAKKCSAAPLSKSKR